MPAFLAPVIQMASAALSVWTGVTVSLATATAIAQGALLVGGLALSSWQAKRAKSKAREAYNAAQVDRMANVVTSIAQRELVLGRVRKGGAVYFRGSAGQHKSTFIAHLALAAHEIDAVELIYLNDRPVTLDASGYVLDEPYARTELITTSGDTAPAEGEYVPGSLSYTTRSIDQDNVVAHYVWQRAVITHYVRISWDLGAGTAVADARTQELFPELWGPSHRGQGVAKLIAEFTYDETAFPSGIPAITARVRGAKVYDPRSGLTAFSENPALLARHVYQHAYFGKAMVSAAEDARFVAAANACDTGQTWTLYDGTSQTVPLYRAGLVAPYGTPARELLDDLTQAMGGMWAFAGGELFIRAGVYTAPVLTLADADLAVIQRQGEAEEQEAVAIAPHRERAQKFNVVNLRIWDEQQGYKQVALSPVKGAALIARDGQELAQEVTLAAVGYAPQAQHVAGIMMRDARDPLVFEASFKMSAWPVEIFDTINVTLARYGWSAKPFTVLQRVWDRAKGTVRLTLKETSAAIYTPDAVFLAQGYAENTSNPSPWDIEPPASLAASSGTGELIESPSGGLLTRVRVTWAALEDASISGNGQIEVQWSYADPLEWHAVRVPGDETEVFITGPADEQTIIIRARTRNAVATSDWGIQLAHYVVGQTARPAAVSGFSVVASSGFALASWSLHSALDVRFGGEIVIRHTPLTSGASWEDGYVLDAFDGRMVSGLVPLMTGTYMAKAKDRTGNWSEAPASFVASEGMVTGFTTVATSTQDTTFPGSKTDLVAVDSVLKLDSGALVDSLTDLVDAWAFVDSIGDFKRTGTYLFDTYMDLATVAVRRFEVGLKVLAYEAADLIDLRTDALDTWDALDGDEVNTCDVTVYAATTNDNPAGTPTWGAWTPFMVADFNCRAVKFKAEVTSGFPTHNINIEQLRVVAKVPT